MKSITGCNNAELARQTGTSRAAPKDWLKGNAADLVSSSAQRFSSKTVFTVIWLATDDGPMHKNTNSIKPKEDRWSFTLISERKIRLHDQKDLIRLETAVLAFAEKYRLDISGEVAVLNIKKHN